MSEYEAAMEHCRTLSETDGVDCTTSRLGLSGADSRNLSLFYALLLSLYYVVLTFYAL